MAGQRLARAPRWTVSGGLNFEQPLSGDMRLAFSADANYTSGFYTDATNKPASWQSAYWLVDSTLRLMNPSSGCYLLRTVDMPLTGGGTGTAGPGALADTSGFVSRGREVMLRVGFGSEPVASGSVPIVANGTRGQHRLDREQPTLFAAGLMLGLSARIRAFLVRRSRNPTGQVSFVSKTKVAWP